MISRMLMAHVEIMRPYTVFYVGLTSLAGALLAQDEPDALRLLGAFAAPTLGWLAGLYGGDYFDRQLDAIDKPHRPIPSGRVPAWVAFAFMVLYIVIGLSIAVSLSWANLLVSLVVLVLGVSYSKFFKAHGLWGHFVRGVPMSLTFVFGMLATAGQIQVTLLPLSLIFFLHDAGTNMIGALRDIEGDRAGGYLTFPVKYGPVATVKFGSLLYLGWIVIALFYPLNLNILFAPYYSLLTVAIILGGAAYAPLWQSSPNISRAQALGAHKVFVLERLFVASSFISAVVGWGFALVVLVPALIITWLSQHFLRDRYEFSNRESEEKKIKSARTNSHSVDVSGYVDQQLRHLRQVNFQLPRDWSRCLKITCSDQELVIFLLVKEGTVQRIPKSVFQDSPKTKIKIKITSNIFKSIFIDRTSNPYRAYLRGQVKLYCAPADMMRLNKIFKAFLNQKDSAVRLRIQQIEELSLAANEDGSTKTNIRHQVVISDTTLRDGEQMPGVAFSVDEKIAIACSLDKLGVPLLEVGYPAVSELESVAIKEIVRLGLKAMIQVIARPLEYDIERALATGADSIAIFIGTSDAHVFNKLHTSKSEIVKKVAWGVAYAKRAGVQVVFAPEDASRTPLTFLQHICQVALDAGADIIAIPDTAGVMTPQAMQSLIRPLTEVLAAPIAVHCHNDLGLATANSIAGLLAGASGVQCSLLGIGERAGNAPLEEVVTILEVVYGCKTGLELTQLAETAQKLAQILGCPIPKNKSIVGSNAFVHESGLHIDGVVRDPSTYEPFSPERVGQQRRFVFGKHTGWRAIQYVLDARGIDNNEVLCRRILKQVKRMGEAKQPLNEAELVDLVVKSKGG
jgi:isopropylmalate/homocitrate/citramalate synthase/4-hydroxybenzoate polyprenyltransferase